MKKETAVVLLILVLVSIATWQIMGISQNTDHPPSAGAATSLSGPQCLSNVAPDSSGTLTVIPNETDAGLTLNTTIAHERGERPNITLTRTAPGFYTLFVTTERQETPGPNETATPERVRDRCRVGNRVESWGRMGLNPDRIRMVVGGETILNRTVPENRTTWEIPRVIDIDSGEAVAVPTETATPDASNETEATATAN
jgi:hypothetical protein